MVINADMQSYRRVTICNFLALLLAKTCVGSHFRGAMIFWKPSADGKSIDIDYRQSWRRTSQHPECNETTIAQGFNYSGGVLRQTFPYSYGSYGNEFSASFAYECTDYSIREDWQTGRGHLTFTPNDTNTTVYKIEYAGCCWIGTLEIGASSSWHFVVTMNTTVRKDTGKMNSSPRIDFPPIVRLQFGCNHTINLPVSDDDGDVIKCRWANISESSSIAEAFPGATLNQDTCTITYMADNTTGWFPVAIQIEDYNYNISSQPLSTIPLQFLVSVESNSTNCTVYEHERPKFIGLTLPDKACVGVVNGTDFTTSITIRSGSGGSISEVNTISPIGLIKSSLEQSNLTGNWHISVKWNPNKTDTVNNVFCFTAVDDAGLSSDQRCITLLAGVPPANIIPNSKLPPNPVLPTSHRVWSVRFDQESKRPTKPAYIYLYHANGTLVETIDVSNSAGVKYSFLTSSTRLQFTTTATLQAGQDYYFLFGQGLVQGKSFCGAESNSVLDPTFWTFSTNPDPFTDVEVRCYKGPYRIPCKESYLSCTENWSFQSPCHQVNIHTDRTKFPHPTSDNKFLICDLSGNAYIAYCPPGEVFHAECSECASRDQVPTSTCGTEAQVAGNPCSAVNIISGKLYFPLPGSLSRYIYCDVWGQPWEQECATGYIWDQSKEMCIQHTTVFVG